MYRNSPIKKYECFIHTNNVNILIQIKDYSSIKVHTYVFVCDVTFSGVSDDTFHNCIN